MQNSDKQLILNYLKGDEKSLEILIKRYLKPVYGFVYRHTGNAQEAEDITQDVFVRAWRNIRKFNRNKSFKTWIFSIARNACIDFLRKKKSIAFSEFEAADGRNEFIENLKDSSLLPDKIAEQANLKDIIDAAIKKLSSKYGTVLSLYYNEYFNFREIAQLMGESPNTIKSRHRRGLVLLKKILIES